MKKSHNGAVAGFIIGAALDVWAVTSFINSGKKKPPPTPDEPSSGCPLVYSWNGHDYVLDSEAVSGSFFKAAQRRDWSMLENLREQDHNLHLRVADLLEETDYIDEVRLMVVEHPRETEIAPTFDGVIHTFLNANPPIEATDLSGNEVLALVQAKDSLLWTSPPLGRNGEDGLTGRDGLLVCFKKPTGAKQVKLRLSLQNTMWGEFLQREFLVLMGHQLENQYRIWNTSEPARNALRKTMVREGMLLVKVWDGQSWKDEGFVWEVGSRVARDQVIVLEIRHIPGDELKLKFESTAGIWMINRIDADYSEDIPTNAVELTALRARDRNGKDVASPLTTLDQEYLSLETGDYVDLVFQLPPEMRQQSNHMKKSYILQLSGFYKIKIPNNRPARMDLVYRMMNEPGFLGIYSRDRFTQRIGHLAELKGKAMP